MNHAEHAAKTDELDRLLNDPETALDAGRIWQLAADLSRHETPQESSAFLKKSAQKTFGLFESRC